MAEATAVTRQPHCAPSSLVDWPVLCRHPVDIDRMAQISGRSVDYIYRYQNEIESAVYPDVPARFASIPCLATAWRILNGLKDGYDEGFLSVLLRMIYLSSTTDQLKELSSHIPSGSEVEWCYLKKVAHICPGE